MSRSCSSVADGSDAETGRASGPAAPPARPWIESDGLEEHLARVGASAEAAAAARALAVDGLAVLDIRSPEVERLCDEAVEGLRPTFADPAVERVQDAWRTVPAVRALAVLAPVLDALQVAYGRAPFAFQTLNFERGSQQHAHADTMHFHALPERFMCGVWLALEDVAEDAGPLFYHPGSHRLPVLSMRDVGIAAAHPTADDYNRSYPAVIARLIAERGLEKRDVLLKKGQALIWAANLLHGGEPILRPGATRRSLVTHYFFEDCAYFTPMTSDVEAGRLSLRLPADVATGGWRWPRRDGRPIWPGWKPFAWAVLQRLQSRPVVYR